jgi:hypothetical protein
MRTLAIRLIAPAHRRSNAPGIVLGQPEKHYIGEGVRWLELMHAIYTANEMCDRIEFL